MKKAIPISKDDFFKFYLVVDKTEYSQKISNS